jgi:glycosyltransferase involved in cell wall biosynthesis
MPGVSVVIPTRGRPKLLRRALDSVVGQTYENFEIIIVIDGPDPATIESLKEFSDTRLTVHVNEQNIGLSGSRNKGVGISRFDFIAFLDDDDFWSEDKLEKQLQAIASAGHPENVIAVTRYAINSLKGKSFPIRFPIEGEVFSEYVFVERQYWMPSTYLASRKLLLKQPFTVGLKGVEDVDWLLRILQDEQAKYVYCEDVLMAYDCTPRDSRLSLNCPWRALFDWAMSNKKRLTKRSFSAFLLRNCVPVAKRGGTPTGTIMRIIRTAVTEGTSTAQDVQYALAVALTPEPVRALVGRAKRALGN